MIHQEIFGYSCYFFDDEKEYKFHMVRLAMIGELYSIEYKGYTNEIDIRDLRMNGKRVKVTDFKKCFEPFIEQYPYIIIFIKNNTNDYEG